MKVYLVGGAVRDQLLGCPVKERDWVVVGGSAEQLMDLGYQQVGKDFPVFLHPHTREEYALARTERKTGKGYYGFECNYGQAVTLEEDLARRDLTINAMAQTKSGKIIDPFQGQKDLQLKKLRHVSPAFSEDPVRVLRVARFAARFHHLGFTIAEETRVLMYEMVKSGELANLVPERVWQEWQRSLEEQNPEIFITSLRACGALAKILPEIDQLFGVPNTQKYHPEIDSGIHSLFALQAAVTLSTDPCIRFGAITHDLGKGATPLTEWPSHHQHDKLGIEKITALCLRLKIPNQYAHFAKLVSDLHLNIHRLYELRASTIVKTLEKADAFRRPERFRNLLLVCEADAQGTGRKVVYNQTTDWCHILDECLKITASSLIAEGYQDAAIKQALHQRRIEQVDVIKNTWKNDEK